MDSKHFDALARRLFTARSRRHVVTAPLGALTASLGLFALVDPEDVVAAKSGKCRPTCGECASCKRGKCEKKEGRNKKRCKRGTCVPLRTGTPCSGGTCQGGACIATAPPPTTCTAVNQPCTASAQCCTGLCNAGGTTTGPFGSVANQCATCLSARSTCTPVPDACCGNRTCVTAPGTGDTVCESDTGEQCIADPAATATAPQRGTCQRARDLCPVAGNSGSPGVCCTASGRTTPRIGTTEVCPESASGCCTGQCNVATDRCCTPDGADPALSGGTACAPGTGVPATQVANTACCSGFCSNALGATVCGPDATP